MTEAQFQEVLIGRYDPRAGGFTGGLLQLHGWRIQHVESVTMRGAGGRTIRKTPGTKGYPDITAARRGAILFLELKSETGQVDAAQVAWLNELCGMPNLTIDDWRSRGEEPNGIKRGLVTVAVVRPRHLDWLRKALQ